MVATAVKVNEELVRQKQFQRCSTDFPRISQGVFSCMISVCCKVLLKYEGATLHLPETTFDRLPLPHSNQRQSPVRKTKKARHCCRAWMFYRLDNHSAAGNANG
jgi:hypothetical protein